MIEAAIVYREVACAAVSELIRMSIWEQKYPPTRTVALDPSHYLLLASSPVAYSWLTEWLSASGEQSLDEKSTPPDL